MTILSFKLTEEEAHLLDRIMEETFARSRSEVIRDALLDCGKLFRQLTQEVADATHARRYYLPRVHRRKGKRVGPQSPH